MRKKGVGKAEVVKNGFFCVSLSFDQLRHEAEAASCNRKFAHLPKQLPQRHVLVV